MTYSVAQINVQHLSTHKNEFFILIQFDFSLRDKVSSIPFFFYNNNKFAGNQKIIIIFKIVYACLKSVFVLDFWQIYREANQVDFLGLFIHLRIHSQHTHMHPLTRTQHATFCLAILTYLFICFFSLFFCFRFRTIWLTTQQQLQ